VKEKTGGSGVSIFVDLIGLPVFIATVKALGRRGVVTTAGWKLGMKTSVIRAIECINRHIHVYTHYARYSQGLAAVRFAEANGWMPILDDKTYGWDEIPQLARDYSEGKVNTYFPVFQINPV
jgi:NADPH:quinone reductase-like Zn-dependent oxidoreductase